jgi:uncharacterized integral membrane protein
VDDKKKADIYLRIRVGGLLCFLPLVLFAGPFAGYVVGDYLQKRFGLPAYVSLFLITVGLVASAMETVRIVKAALRESRS